MTELEKLLSDNYNKLAQQYDLDMKQLSQQVSDLQEQVMVLHEILAPLMSEK